MNFVLVFLTFLTVLPVLCKTAAYDFIIIGGGTAGSIVATRLSEISCFNVLVLEAGGEPPIITQVPVLSEVMPNTEVDWNHTSVPQMNAFLNYPERKVNVTHGKMLGGTGNLNNMNFFRGNKLDFTFWEQSGSSGWGWGDVLPFLKMIENDTEIDVDYDDHGHSGPICISNPGREDPFVNQFIEAVKKSGYSHKDPNGDGTQTGYSYAAINVCENKRQSTYFKYLKPVMRRTNLDVIKNAFVEKIKFFNKRAVGVIYSINGRRKFVKANKEIILSAGAINSPHVLMLSGIGPRAHLSKFKIKVISNLPVGRNLQDHLRVTYTFTKPYEDIYNDETLKQFFEGSGPLIKFSYGNAFVNTLYSGNNLYPDIQLSLRGFSAPQKPGQTMKYLLRTYILRPKSRGFVQLRSRNPFAAPLIDPMYLTKEEDVIVLAEGSKMAYMLMKSMNVSEFGYTMTEPDAPNCNIYDKNINDEYWYCVVRNIANTIYHFSGTCKMGKKEDSVVDNELNVKRVKGLRVIDASVMPRITSSNIQAAVMMIAEKGSDLIKKKYAKCN